MTTQTTSNLDWLKENVWWFSTSWKLPFPRVKILAYYSLVKLETSHRLEGRAFLPPAS